MNRYDILFITAIITVLFSACNSYKRVPYFQSISRTSDSREEIRNFTPLTIQNSDILSIYVTSLNPLAFSDSSSRLAGYLVDQNGQIELPLIGKQKVAGLTTSMAAEQIKKRLTPYLKEPAVNVRMMNFKIAVLGDVSKPDVFKVPSERITLTEALSMAGDLNITAKRTNVLLIREIDGKREFIPIDLTSGKVFNSPYYYLKNNDVIYVEPDKTKYSSVDTGYRNVSLFLSFASIITIILTSVL